MLHNCNLNKIINIVVLRNINIPKLVFQVNEENAVDLSFARHTSKHLETGGKGEIEADIHEGSATHV